MDPLQQFHTDRAAARQAQDPMASVCSVANVDANGNAQVRTLVLREVNDEHGPQLALFVNASSPKWPHLDHCSVMTYWPSVDLQYRFDVVTTPLDPQVVADSWQLRPDVPKRMDWLYQSHPQSSPIADRSTLLANLDKQPQSDILTAPESARGLRLIIQSMERLDLAQSNGVHDRRRYHRQDDEWHETILVP